MAHCFRLSLVFPLLLVSTLAAKPKKHPNVVVILADDQGWGDLSAHGNSDLSTPNIDSRAEQGVMLDRFYVCPMCSPTRAEFLTGRYHTRGGVFSTSTGGKRLDLDEKTIADAFHAAGYATGVFGKWHNGIRLRITRNHAASTSITGFARATGATMTAPSSNTTGA